MQPLKLFLQFVSRWLRSRRKHDETREGNIEAAIRPILFQTPNNDYPYVTNGGTIFIVKFRGVLYGVTCMHALRGFDLGTLFVLSDKNPNNKSLGAPLESYHHPSAPEHEAVDTDINDICIITFKPNISDDFFGGTEFTISEETVGTSRVGQRLVVLGVLKEKINLFSSSPIFGYCRLEFHDAGPHIHDHILRRGKSKYAAPEFSSLTGISGAPVFNRTENKLCGMVVRGSLAENIGHILFVDVYDILQLLDGVIKKANGRDYKKKAADIYR